MYRAWSPIEPMFGLLYLGDYNIMGFILGKDVKVSTY